jgi:hypothetical protein
MRQWLRFPRVGGSSLVTAAGPCRNSTGFPILPTHRRSTSQQFVPPTTVPAATPPVTLVGRRQPAIPAPPTEAPSAPRHRETSGPDGDPTAGGLAGAQQDAAAARGQRREPQRTVRLGDPRVTRASDDGDVASLGVGQPPTDESRGIRALSMFFDLRARSS